MRVLNSKTPVVFHVSGFYIKKVLKLKKKTLNSCVHHPLNHVF